LKVPTNHKTIKMTVLASMLMTIFQPALAQEQQQAEEQEEALQIERIEVTARKRAESLLNVPVSVTALTSDDIEKRGVVQVKDLADQTPGLVVSDNFSGKTDRTVQNITLRGFAPTTGTEATTAMFIDGVPVTSTSAMSSVGSPARVEILRGPQSAYFGRNTFAGAVNVVSAEPNDWWSGSIEATLGNYDYQRLRGEVEGVLIQDKLSFRASVETYDKEGAWDNAGSGGGTLGDQKTSMANLFLLARPVDGLTLKAFGFMSKDEDGPAASAFISAVDIKDFAGNVVVQGQANCTTLNAPYFCGSFPTKADPVSYNTDAIAGIKTLLSNPANRLTSTSALTNYGMHREYQHGHLVADWEIPNSDFTLSSLTGVNKEEWALLNDIDHYGANFFNYAAFVERTHDDFSQELRVSYDTDGPLTGSFGVSYLDASRKNSLTNLISFSPVPATITAPAESKAETKGVFFGVNYDITDKLSTSVEGRFQTDKITALNTTGNVVASESFNNFLPRFILDYQINDATMVFGSYSKGANPSSFNTGLLVQSAFVQEKAAEAGITLTLDPEEVDNYELGLKGSAMGGAMNYALAAYYAQWRKQIIRSNIVVVEPGATTATSFSGVSNAGSVDLYGLELETSWMLSRNLRLNASGAYTGSEIKSFQNAALTALTSMTDFSGKEQPGISKYSGNLGLQYTNTFAKEYDYFVRGDYVYKSGQWLNQANFVKTGDVNRVNLRAGVTIGNFDIQAYVNNLFDDDTYTSGYDYYAFDASFAYFGLNSGVVLGLPQPRTFGVQVKWSFFAD